MHFVLIVEIVEKIKFSCILYEVWFTARFDVFFTLLNVTKMINIFLPRTFPLFVKATNLFNATAHHA